jgi:hypothetical protein
MREVFGEYRAPTGVSGASGRRGARRGGRACARCEPAGPCGCSSPSRASTATRTAPSRSPWRRATPAWRSSTPASGRRRPDRGVGARRGPDVIGVSILSGSHLELVPDLVGKLRARASTCRWWSAASSPRTTARSWRRRASPGLHPEGLRAREDHDRHRRHRRHPLEPAVAAPDDLGTPDRARAAEVGRIAPGSGGRRCDGGRVTR